MTIIRKFNNLKYTNAEEGTNVWKYCILLPNALVGEFTMFGAGSIVTKNLIPSLIVLENLVKLLKKIGEKA